MSDEAKALAWLAKRPNHEVSFDAWSEDGQWQVHKVTGPRSDREWSLVGSGDTPLAAIKNAMEGGRAR